MKNPEAPNESRRRRVTLERSFRAPLTDVWELWTTKDGIESWWGPEGFRVEVHAIDLRPGGKLRYDMIAVAPEQIAFLKQAGMPARHPDEREQNPVENEQHRGDDQQG